MPACALCGTPAPAPFRAPPQEGSPDLDGRPGEPTRSTLRKWLQRCRACGACAPDVSALPAGRDPVVRTEAYRTQTSMFLRWAMLVDGTPDEAQALLQAAWEAEDAGADATVLRRRAIAVWPQTGDVEATLRLADVQRRAGLLADAAATLDSLPARLDDAAQRIAGFERARIASGDTGRHLISSALRPPASRPHVAHGAAPTKFWGRLFGGAKP